MGIARVVRPEDERETIQAAGDEYRYLTTGEETDGRYFIMEGLVPPGGGPPPHIQTREEEGFYILEGTVTFWVDGDEIEASIGTFLHVPRGVEHNFQNRSDQPARMLIIFAPAGIEHMMTKMAASPDQFMEIGAEYGVEFPDHDSH